ncbi:thiolase domain-containing protein [Nonomuraea lactucae]|uniref:thiolase domain-containing protein n=1 Tax=Nonomuraea lactucae TaxID=2249762 RepID=UPI000DE38DA3|nr:thiolase domain-containing protein [Nonomuraea lactucae]
MLDQDLFIAGWGHSRFGRLEDQSLETLVVSVADQALRCAGLEPGEVDAIFLGQFNAGLHPLAFTSSLALQVSPDLFGVPATRVENACASGAAAVHQGIAALLAGTAERVLVIGAEKMTHACPATVGSALLGADYELAGHQSETGFAGIFASVATAYQDRYGPVSDALGAIAAKNHRNGVHNPYAHLRKDLGAQFCQNISDANPVVAGPLRRTDCSPVSDGAAALVLTRDRLPHASVEPVRIIGFAQANDFLPRGSRDPLVFRGSEAAWWRAHEMAGTYLADLDLVELHDCFTIAELILYEAIGLTDRGKGRMAIDNGWVTPEGCMPVNVSGGLKAKGHPVGATGVSQHVMAALQLTGTAGDMQLPTASLAAVHNMGGLAVANYVSILESTG